MSQSVAVSPSLSQSLAALWPPGAPKGAPLRGAQALRFFPLSRDLGGLPPRAPWGRRVVVLCGPSPWKSLLCFAYGAFQADEFRAKGRRGSRYSTVAS